MIQGAQISNSWTPGTEAGSRSGWRWVCGTCRLGASQVTTPLERGVASSRVTDAPLFLQRLFKGLIDRPRGGGGLGRRVWGHAWAAQRCWVERWRGERQGKRLVFNAERDLNLWWRQTTFIYVQWFFWLLLPTKIGQHVSLTVSISNCGWVETTHPLHCVDIPCSPSTASSQRWLKLSYESQRIRWSWVL